MNILVLGATSAISKGCMRHWAQERHAFFLAARDPEKLETVRRDLLTLGAPSVALWPADLNDIAVHSTLVEAAAKTLGTIDVVLVSYGVLGSQEEGEEQPAQALEVFNTNFTYTACLLLEISKIMMKQKSGTLAVVSSVAGDRGRKSNFIYGSSKAGLNVFLQGLKGRLAPYGVRVLTIKPGFVNTPMTQDFRKGLLWVQPHTIGRLIVTAIRKGKSTVYLPWFWRPIMKVIRMIPERIFIRLPL